MASENEPFSRLRALGHVELICLIGGFALPLFPSKTGRPRGHIAEIVVDDPTYLHDVAVTFVLLNAMFALLLLAAWLYTTLKGKPVEEGDSGPDSA